MTMTMKTHPMMIRWMHQTIRMTMKTPLPSRQPLNQPRHRALKALTPEQEQEKHHGTSFQTQKVLSLHG
jgi:hypothetical protein